MTHFDFADKVALVTGGASGIGLACIKTFAQAGAKVVIADRQRELAQAAIAILPASSSATYVEVDVANPDSAQAMVDAVVAKFGRLDFAVNNAGIGGNRRTSTSDYSVAAWQDMININLSGVFYCLRAEMPVMVKQGGGAIVNLASILGSRAVAGAPAYTASKHGVVGLTRAAALDHAKDGVRVNAIGPGYIETPMIAGATATAQLTTQLIARHPIGRLGKPQEIANLVAFLCSEQASFITGGYYLADGGYTAQ